MCTQVKLPDGRTLSTQREFADWLGKRVARLRTLPGHDERALLGRMCLCPVDLETELIGHAWHRDECSDLVVSNQP